MSSHRYRALKEQRERGLKKLGFYFRKESGHFVVEQDKRYRIEFSLVRGLPHSEKGPAYRKTVIATGKTIEEDYYVNGVLHREDGPAGLNVDPETGIVLTEAYYIRENIHRDGDLPAFVTRYRNGNLKQADWFKHGEWNRPRANGPVGVYFHANGKLESIYYASGPEGFTDYSAKAPITPQFRKLASVIRAQYKQNPTQG